ncbi:MAG: hypothetical protein DRJ69_06265 [Thermoprotei archaeon]|nr:MAG: hypothetical protein DRJ69_06265 [Thermoprotei archaeon]
MQAQLGVSADPIFVNDRLDGLEIRVEDPRLGAYWRVVKLARVRRVPREVAQVETLIEMHRDVVAGFRLLPQARLVVIGAFSKKLGLPWCYGVAVSDYDLDRAVAQAEECYQALVASLRGSYRQILIGSLSRVEAGEVLRLLFGSKHGAVLWGLPEPRAGSFHERSYIGERIGVRIIEVLEEVLRGLMAQGKEYAYVVLGQAVPPEKLSEYLRYVGELASRYSDFEGNA